MSADVPTLIDPGTSPPDEARTVAVIADIVRSRSHADRSRLQEQIEAVLLDAEEAAEAHEPFTATVGDEFQAVYGSLPAALAATLHIMLALPSGTSLRFGLGLGGVTPVDSRTSTAIQDGPGWWRAREALVRAEEAEAHRPSRHTWLRGPDPAQEATVNAYLLLRDMLIDGMNDRTRSYARGAAQGKPQAAIAEAHGVSQSAVSQALRRSGASELLEGMRLLEQASAAADPNAAEEQEADPA